MTIQALSSGPQGTSLDLVNESVLQNRTEQCIHDWVMYSKALWELKKTGGGKKQTLYIRENIPHRILSRR